MIRNEARQEDDLQLNMAPLIDMVFLLIIFFLTVTSFTQPEREQDVLLPSNSTPGGMSRESEQNVVVNVMSDGGLRLLGRPTTEGELTASLRLRREKANKPLKVLVRADRRTAYANVALALAAVERAGVQRPYIITRLVDLGE
jgi:biopolymer transport protein ExbD